MSADNFQEQEPAPRWRPLSAVQRRVVGVLVEKAKTTPEAYPMTLNALTNGCNQKSNRAPQMQLSPDEVEEAMEELRELGAAAEVQSGGRVARFRHYMYDWLGVDKVELAVMTELLLRGPQTIGELRGRAARMEPIADLQTLRPVMDSLEQKNLIVSLTSAGRGQVVSHNLYLPEQLEKLKQQYASGLVPAATVSPSVPSSPPPAAAEVSAEEFEQLRSDVEQLHADMAMLREEIERLKGI